MGGVTGISWPGCLCGQVALLWSSARDKKIPTRLVKVHIHEGDFCRRICCIKRATAYVHRKQHCLYMPIRRCSRIAMRRMTTLCSLLQAAAVTNYLLFTMVHFRGRRAHTWTGMSDCLCWSFHNSTCVRFSARISQMCCMHQFTLGEYYQKRSNIYLTAYTYKHISYCIHL